MSGGTAVLNKVLTNDRKGVKTSDYSTDYIYQGKCYSVSQRITVTAATNMMVLFNMAPCVDREVSVYTPVFDATTGPINIDYYIGSNYAGGTSFTINNRAYYGRPNKCLLTYGATGTSKGTKFSEGFVVSGHKSSASSQEGLEFVPPQGSNILVELDNTNGTDATVFVNFVWFEIGG